MLFSRITLSLGGVLIIVGLKIVGVIISFEFAAERDSNVIHMQNCLNDRLCR